jgi:chemotaxis protein methyltransferase CheR
MSSPDPKLASSAGQANAGVLSAKAYAFMQKYIQAETGIVVDSDKQYLLECRLLPIIRDHRIDSLEVLTDILANKSSVLLPKLVAEAMTTNETLFFRDKSMFDALRDQVFPALFDKIHGTRKVRIWSAAASSGQEAYTLAMVLLEMGKTKADVEIIGTDFSSQILERARQGRYVQFEVNRGLPASLLMKYFIRTGLDWQINDQVRGLTRFEQLDLRRDFNYLGKFDLILCRNVLIYFDTETKAKILHRIHGLLSPAALLALGCSETVINVHGGFQRVSHNQSTFYIARQEP